MTDIATLGFAIDSRQVRSAEADLKGIQVEAAKTSAATSRMAAKSEVDFARLSKAAGLTSALKGPNLVPQSHQLDVYYRTLQKTSKEQLVIQRAAKMMAGDINPASLAAATAAFKEYKNTLLKTATASTSLSQAELSANANMAAVSAVVKQGQSRIEASSAATKHAADTAVVAQDRQAASAAAAASVITESNGVQAAAVKSAAAAQVTAGKNSSTALNEMRAATIASGESAEVASLRIKKMVGATSGQTAANKLLGESERSLAERQGLRVEATAAQRAATAALVKAQETAMVSTTGMLRGTTLDTAATEANTVAQVVNTKAKEVNSRVSAEVGILAGEIATGNFARLKRSSAALANQTGLLAKAMSPLGLAIIAVVAIVGTFVAALIKGYNEQRAFQKALISTGNTAGVTVGQLDKMRDSVAGSDADYGKASDALLVLAKSGKFVGEELETAAQAAVSLANITGDKVADAAKQIEALGKGPTEAIAKLNEQYHFLTLAQYDYIASLEKEGKTQEATTASAKDAAQAFKQRADEVQSTSGTLARAAGDVGDAFARMWQNIKDEGRNDLQYKLQQAVDQLKAAQAAIGTNVPGAGVTRAQYEHQGGSGPNIAAQKAYAAALQKTVDKLRAQVDAQNAAAQAQADAQRVNDAGIAAREKINALLGQNATKAEQLAAKVKDLKNSFADLVKAQTQALISSIASGNALSGLSTFFGQQKQNVADYIGLLKSLQTTTHNTTSATISAGQQLVNSLKEQVATFGLVGKAKEAYTIASTKMTASQRAEANALNATLDVKRADAAATKAAADAKAAADKVAEGGMSTLVAMYDRAHDSLIDIQDALGGASREQIKFNRTQRDADAALKKAGYSMKAVAQHVKVMGEAVKKAAADADLDKAFDLQRLVQRYTQQSPFQEQISALHTLKDALKTVTDEFNAATDAKIRLAKAKEIKVLHSAIDGAGKSVRVGFVDVAQDALLGIRSMTREGSKSYAALTIAADAFAMVKGVTAILNAGTNGDGYTAVARMAAVAAVVAPLLANIGQTISGIGGSGFSDTAAKRQKTQGTGTVLGDAEAKSESILNATKITADATSSLVGINRGMLTALQALQVGLGSAGGMLARGAGAADFSGMNLAVKSIASMTAGPGTSGRFAPNGLLGGMPDLLNVFGSKSKITDSGIKIVGGALADMINHVAIGAYQEVQSKSWAFGSKHTKEAFQSITGEFSTQFQLILSSIADTVRVGAATLGLLPADIESAVNAFQIAEQHISLKGLNAEDQQKALEAVFSKIFDNLAGAVVPFIGEFQKVGEGLGETMIRVATEVQVTQEAVKQLGLAVTTTDPQKYAEVADGLITAAGGIDSFITSMQSFVSKFAPANAQFTAAQDSLTSAFAQLGLKLPTTRDGMFALMQTLDATTAAGQSQIATLLSLTDTASSYYDLLDARAKAQYDYATLIDSIKADGGMTLLSTQLRDINKWSIDTAKKLNDLAKASGFAGASAEDLALVQQDAAHRAADAIASIGDAAQDLASKLYGVMGTSLEAINAQLATAKTAAQQALALQLGDNSPLGTKAKLDLALKGLRSGTTTADQVLTIGKELYRGQDYRALYEKVMAITGTPAGTGSLDNLDALAKTQQKLQAQKDAMDRFNNAKQLASYIADLSSAKGNSLTDEAASLGVNLNHLGHDLGVDNTLGYLSKLKLQGGEGGAITGALNGINGMTDVLGKISTGTNESVTLLKSIDSRLQAIESSNEKTSDNTKVSADGVKTSAVKSISMSTRATA